MTTMKKGKDGWAAEDTIDFNGQQKLTISTRKSSTSGTLVTRASVSTHSDGMISHSFALGGAGGDYSERVIVTPTRCTEKTVAEQHAKAMQQIADIEARARAHYEKKLTVAA